MFKKKLLILSTIIFITGCSNNDIEKKIIDGKTYYIIDSKEDLIWLSNPNLFLKFDTSSSQNKLDDEDKLRFKWSANYLQTNNIDLKTKKEENTLGFMPIGSKRIPFSGTYNGKGYSISNLYINRPEQDQIGLFSVLENCTLDSINLVNISITGKTSVGGLAGKDHKSLISNSHVNGTLKSEDFFLGGLIGEKKNGKITYSSFKGKLEANKSYVGGLVGDLQEAIITNSNSIGEVIGWRNIGGIAGRNSGDYDYDNGSSQNEIGPGSINNCFSSATIKGKREIGGIVGQSSIGSIFYCYFNGSVFGNYATGGIIGNDTSSLVFNCYNSGSINCTEEYAGGIVGEMRDIYHEYDSFIDLTYSTGNIKGKKFVGGIVGSIKGNINNSYATGDVIGEKNVGGVVGELNFNGLISNTSAIGKITGKENVGGIAGVISGMLEFSENDEVFFKTLANELKNSLGNVGAQVTTKNAGNKSYAIVKNCYWNKLLTNQNSGIGKIRYSKNNKRFINGTKSLTKADFLKEVSSLKALGYKYEALYLEIEKKCKY